MIHVFSSSGCRSHTEGVYYVCAGLANGNLAFYDQYLINVSTSCAHHMVCGVQRQAAMSCVLTDQVLSTMEESPQLPQYTPINAPNHPHRKCGEMYLLLLLFGSFVPNR